jgi:hypothetical protein
MSCDIEAAAVPRRIWRVGRAPDAWAWPDWRFAGPDGTFGHRFDDPRGEYRVLYASSQRFGALVEALAPYRPHPALLEWRRHLRGTVAADGLAPGTVPADWLAGRTVGEAQPGGAFTDVGHSRSLRLVRDRLGAQALAGGVEELDAAAIRLSAPRALTQAISRIVFDCGPPFSDSWVEAAASTLGLWLGLTALAALDKRLCRRVAGAACIALLLASVAVTIWDGQ